MYHILFKQFARLPVPQAPELRPRTSSESESQSLDDDSFVLPPSPSIALLATVMHSVRRVSIASSAVSFAQPACYASSCPSSHSFGASNASNSIFQMQHQWQSTIEQSPTVGSVTVLSMLSAAAVKESIIEATDFSRRITRGSSAIALPLLINKSFVTPQRPRATSDDDLQFSMSLNDNDARGINDVFSNLHSDY